MNRLLLIFCVCILSMCASVSANATEYEAQYMMDGKSYNVNASVEIRRDENEMFADLVLNDFPITMVIKGEYKQIEFKEFRVNDLEAEGDTLDSITRFYAWGNKIEGIDKDNNKYSINIDFFNVFLELVYSSPETYPQRFTLCLNSGDTHGAMHIIKFYPKLSSKDIKLNDALSDGQNTLHSVNINNLKIGIKSIDGRIVKSVE